VPVRGQCAHTTSKSIVWFGNLDGVLLLCAADTNMLSPDALKLTRAKHILFRTRSLTRYCSFEPRANLGEEFGVACATCWLEGVAEKLRAGFT
jgi:hypothetical protein